MVLKWGKYASKSRDIQTKVVSYGVNSESALQINITSVPNNQPKNREKYKLKRWYDERWNEGGGGIKDKYHVPFIM